MQELTSLLEIKLNFASLKHAQTFGTVERSHAALKRFLKINTDNQWNDWHKYVPLAIFIHNTSYHNSIGCFPTSGFHGREAVKPPDLRISRKTMAAVEANSDYFEALQDSMMNIFCENKLRLFIENKFDSYQRYRNYYDTSSETNPSSLMLSIT